MLSVGPTNLIETSDTMTDVLVDGDSFDRGNTTSVAQKQSQLLKHEGNRSSGNEGHRGLCDVVVGSKTIQSILSSSVARKLGFVSPVQADNLRNEGEFSRIPSFLGCPKVHPYCTH